MSEKRINGIIVTVLDNTGPGKMNQLASDSNASNLLDFTLIDFLVEEGFESGVELDGRTSRHIESLTEFGMAPTNG